MASKRTAEQILDVAQLLCQSRGYSGFSFRDIAKRLGIKSASIHYHFPTKDALGIALMVRYRGEFISSLSKISATEKNPRKKLEAFAAHLQSILEDNSKLCLCGILAAEVNTLSPALKRELGAFFDAAEHWVQEVLEDGKRAKVFQFSRPSALVAQGIVASLQGMMLCARALGSTKRFSTTTDWLYSTM